MEEGIKKIFIVGAGTMGYGLAQAFATGGYQVSMFSRTQQTLDRASTLMKSSLETMAEAEDLAGEAFLRYMEWVCHFRG